jgi:hypothetical protein
MARTRQTARISTGGRGQRRSLAREASRKTVPNPDNVVDEEVDDSEYPVYAIANRRDVPDGSGHEYHVIWWAARGRMERTWEPRSFMEAQGFDDELNAVDEWIASESTMMFMKWAAINRPAVLTASASGMCLFEALRLALEILGDHVGVPPDEVDQFIRALESRGIQVDAGLKWKVFYAFVRRVSSVGSRIDLVSINSNLHASGHRRQDAIKRLNLADGIYLVGAMNSSRVGHAFVLAVEDGKLTARNGDEVQAFDGYGVWIDRVMFVRKVQFVED